MWAWSSHSCLSKCRRRHHRRSRVLLKDSSKATIWASGLLICEPGALQPYLSKCSDRNQRRNKLVLKGCFKASLWIFRVLINGHCQLCLSKCSKRNHKRNGLALKGSSKSNIWVHRLLIFKPGALKPYLSKCSKRNHRGNQLVLQGLFKSALWVFRVLVCGHGVLSSIWASIIREAIEGMSWLWGHYSNQVLRHAECRYVGWRGRETSALFEQM